MAWKLTTETTMALLDDEQQFDLFKKLCNKFDNIEDDEDDEDICYYVMYTGYTARLIELPIVLEDMEKQDDFDILYIVSSESKGVYSFETKKWLKYQTNLDKKSLPKEITNILGKTMSYSCICFKGKGDYWASDIDRLLYKWAYCYLAGICDIRTPIFTDDGIKILQIGYESKSF